MLSLVPWVKYSNTPGSNNRDRNGMVHPNTLTTPLPDDINKQSVIRRSLSYVRPLSFFLLVDTAPEIPYFVGLWNRARFLEPCSIHELSTSAPILTSKTCSMT